MGVELIVHSVVDRYDAFIQHGIEPGDGVVLNLSHPDGTSGLRWYPEFTVVR